MQYIIFILLGLFIVHLVIRLRKKEMQLLELQTKLYQMQTETEQAVRTAEEATAIKDEILLELTTHFQFLLTNHISRIPRCAALRITYSYYFQVTGCELLVQNRH